MQQLQQLAANCRAYGRVLPLWNGSAAMPPASPPPSPLRFGRTKLSVSESPSVGSWQLSVVAVWVLVIGGMGSQVAKNADAPARVVQ